MTNEPASGERERGPALREGSVVPAQPIVTADVTKELAQLLAASIAHSQTQHNQTQHGQAPLGQQRAAGMPTNSELTSLAALMANAPATRAPLPRSRDDLSSLSYLRPQGVPAPLAAPAHLAYPVQQMAAHVAPAEQIHDDEPMPIPSTWRQPPVREDERNFMKQLGAATFGLVAGLVLVVPAVLWISGWVGPQKRAEQAAVQRGETRPVQLRLVEQQSDNATFYGDLPTGNQGGAEPTALSTASMTRAPLLDATQQLEHLLVQARLRIEGGDVQGARELLSQDATNAAPVLFALAETYDPNMLAAWGSRGVSADVQRARALYARALDMGLGRAMSRLDSLK